ncbi:MAG: GFA family protein [Myxococcota bacterium]
MKRTGACLCGRVSLRAELRSKAIHVCHCTQCQTWTGGGGFFSVGVTSLSVEGEEAISAYRASEWGERASCGTCGTILWWRMQGRPVAYIAAGLLEDQTELSVEEEIFVDHRACWLPAFPEASQSTEAEEHAKLQAFLDRQNDKA